MAMGTRKQRERQEPLWYRAELAEAPGHPFYRRLNQVLEKAGFDPYCEQQCREHYHESLGRHLKHTLNRWILHYNHGRVHMSLGPGIPAPLKPSPPHSEHRHRLPPGHRVRRKAVLGGLHHEYWLEKIAA